jgi:hypothetical protein
VNMITVKLADPDRKVWISTLADYLEPGATVEVPDVLFWRNEIRRGALVEVVAKPSDPPPPADTTAASPTQPTAPASAPPTSATTQPAASKAKGKDKKGKGNTSKPSDPPPPADSTRGPALGSVITKAERFGED